MGRLADRLDDIRVRARAPDSEIDAELRHRTDIVLSFGESEYDFISERALENSLAMLARQLYAGWLREYRAAIDETGWNIDPVDLHDHNFFEERDQVEASGESSDSRIHISAVGTQNSSVQIARGTVRELCEHEFVARVTEAATLMIRDFQQKVRELQVRYYG